MPQERLSLDFRLYIPSGESDSWKAAENRLAHDLATLYQETAPHPEQRITQYDFEVMPKEELVFCPDYDDKRDIREMLSWKTPGDQLESKATLRICDFLLTREPPFIITWILPPNKEMGYPEGRLVIGTYRLEDQRKMVHNYGLCLDFPREYYSYFAQELISRSIKPDKKLTSLEELRETPIFIQLSPDDDPLDLISQLIHAPEVWKRIRSGQAQERQKRALEDARPNAQRRMTEIRTSAPGRFELIQIGARAEREMERAGWEKGPDSGCGLSNTKLLSSLKTNQVGAKHTSINLNTEKVGENKVACCGKLWNKGQVCLLCGKIVG